MMMTPQDPGFESGGPLAMEELEALDAYWRAANYLSVGQIFLLDNPLLRQPLLPEHVKPRLLGHWGTTPGLNFIYVHLNRVIRERDLDMIFIAGPGHGGPALVANVWLEGTYSEYYPGISEDEAGMKRLFRQFSFPGGVPSHVAPETPGSIHEGGELGYALSHAFGAAFDNPDLVVACVVGDGEAETGPLAASWHSSKFLNPSRDGAVLPVLHLNGYKIANPALLARMPHDELESLLNGYGYKPWFVEGSDPARMHQAMAAALDACLDEIREIQREARSHTLPERPLWPMIVLRSPKGWTGPSEVDGLKTEDFWRSHQVPFSDVRTSPAHLAQLEAWMRSYRPEELFTPDGGLKPELKQLAPTGQRRMGDNPHANGGLLLRSLKMPDFREYAVTVPFPGSVEAEATKALGAFLRDVMRLNEGTSNFRVFGPDETASNRLGSLFEVTGRCWMDSIRPYDDHLSRNGRVMEILSEHTCQGWLEGYLLTGRHGFFSCYEAFIHIIDSMFNQHAKWLKVMKGSIPWRRPVASLNYLLTSHVWRQDHNGFSHQDPGFIDHVVNKKADVIRVYLPPDANTLLSVADHCLRSRNYINVIVAGKQPAWQWLDMDAAVRHCTSGIGIWEWASNDLEDGDPDVVMASAGDVPTLETLAAVEMLREMLPDLRVRVINVVDLMTLQPREEHPHGLKDRDFDDMFTTDKPVIFAYHGYPWLISPADLSSHQPRQPACSRLQGGGHDYHAVRYGRDERSRPVPSCRRCGRPGAEAAAACGLCEAVCQRLSDQPSRVYSQIRRGYAGNPQLALERRGRPVMKRKESARQRHESQAKAATRPMRKVMHSHSRKIGQPPGTLFHTGEQKIVRPVITVFGYDEERHVRLQVDSIAECRALRERFRVLWVNIDGLHEVRVVEDAGREFGIHLLTQEDILHTQQRPKIEEFDDYLFLVLEMLGTAGDSDEVVEEQLSMVLGKGYVITFQEKPGDMFDGIRERISTSGTALRKRGADYLAYALIDAVADNYFKVLEQFESRIELLDTQLLDQSANTAFQSIYTLKKELILLRKSVWPMREIINSISRDGFSVIDEASTGPFFRDIYDNIILVIETVETYRDIVIGMYDTRLAIVNNRMNEIMKVLTIIATVFMPLSFIAGVYGMNFRYMPELAWRWGYFAVLGFMAAVFAGMMRYFRTKRWF